jgi:hypothetical protein
MSEEDRIDEIIRSAASDYNRPPATPRDEMWSAILAARSAPGPRLHVAAGGWPSGYTAARRFGAKYAWIGMAAAAVLLIATGIGIGRYTNRTTASTVHGNPVQVIANNPAPASVPSDPEIGAPAPTPTTTTEPAPAASSSQSQQPTQRTREQIRQDPHLRVIKPVNPNRYASAPGNQGAPLNSNVYQVAMVRHLADADALLSSFSLGSRDAAMNAQFAGWAKGLLSNTRLLLDSPAGDDPRRAKLLQDLELVLAQIVQLAPDARAEDRQLIEGSILEGHVMTRLRTAIPADSTRGILER